MFAARLPPQLVQAGPLLVSLTLLSVAHGGLATLVSVQVERGGQADGTTLLVLTGYSAGLVLGALAGAALVGRFGERRALVAAALVLSLHTAALAWTGPGSAWVVLRVAGGAAAAVLFIGTESVLGRLGAARRGLVFGAYIMLLQLGFAAAQPMVTALGTREAFVGCAVLYAAFVPGALLSRKPRRASRSERAPSIVPLLGRRLALPTLGAAGAGVATGVLVYFGPIYALRLSLGDTDVGVFMTCVLGGGMLLCVPLGRLSDGSERAASIAWVSALLAVASGALATLSGGWLALPLAALLGALGFALYPLCASLGNDRVTPDEALSASGAFVLAFAVGSVAAPATAALAMRALGPAGMPLAIAAVASIVAAVATADVLAGKSATARSALRLRSAVNLDAPGVPLVRCRLEGAQRSARGVLGRRGAAAGGAHSEPRAGAAHCERVARGQGVEKQQHPAAPSAGPSRTVHPGSTVPSSRLRSSSMPGGSPGSSRATTSRAARAFRATLAPVHETDGAAS